MYEYKIKLNFKVENCAGCPFRHEFVFHEYIQSQDKLSGVLSIIRRNSTCALREESILMNEQVEYNNKCPLRGNILYIEDNNK